MHRHKPDLPHALLDAFSHTLTHTRVHAHEQVFDMLAEHASITWVDAPVPANAT
jgi:hypothetical protein